MEGLDHDYLTRLLIVEKKRSPWEEIWVIHLENLFHIYCLAWVRLGFPRPQHKSNLISKYAIPGPVRLGMSPSQVAALTKVTCCFDIWHSASETVLFTQSILRQVKLEAQNINMTCWFIYIFLTHKLLAMGHLNLLNFFIFLVLQISTLFQLWWCYSLISKSIDVRILLKKQPILSDTNYLSLNKVGWAWACMVLPRAVVPGPLHSYKILIFLL